MTLYEELVADGQDAEGTYVTVDRGTDRAVVTLSDPDRLNVLSAPLVVQLKAALVELTADPAVRTIVLTGADPGFCAGGDLRMMALTAEGIRADAGTSDVWRWIRNEFGAIARLIARADTAFVAALNGAAAGVGLAWALTCDIVIASEQARIVPAFGRLGLLPEVGTSWALTRALGYQGAFAFYARGRHLTAEEAREAGLVHEVVPQTSLLDAADEWCERIGALPAHALEMTKPLLRAAADATWDHAITMEEFAEPTCFTTGPFQRQVQALLTER
jgi:2-(1,2-epoxy-1,2-dihydrophenyl)acetyl-CoA isomerase